MRFLAADESKALDKKLRRALERDAQPKATLCYTSGKADYRAAAQLIAQAAGEFAEAAVLFSFSIPGDGWEGRSLAHPGWKSYRDWRRELGEERRLYDAPGHLMERGENQHLARLIEFALDLGWDALVASKPGKNLLWLSHDDCVEILAGFDACALAKRLRALGHWCAR